MLLGVLWLFEIVVFGCWLVGLELFGGVIGGNWFYLNDFMLYFEWREWWVWKMVVWIWVGWEWVVLFILRVRVVWVVVCWFVWMDCDLWGIGFLFERMWWGVVCWVFMCLVWSVGKLLVI